MFPMSEDAPAVFEPPSIERLHELEALCRKLLEVMIPSWYTGRSGRMKKGDTFRKNILRTVTLIDLRRGKVPSVLTQKVLAIESPVSGMSPEEKKLLASWVAQQETAEDTTQTLVTEALSSGRSFGVARAVPRGRPKTWKLDFGKFKGSTLDQIGRLEGGPSYICKFLAGDDYTWSFPKMLPLFWELGRLERVGANWQDKHSSMRYDLRIPAAARQAWETYIDGDDWAADATAIAAARSGGQLNGEDEPLVTSAALIDALARVRVRTEQMTAAWEEGGADAARAAAEAEYEAAEEDEVEADQGEDDDDGAGAVCKTLRAEAALKWYHEDARVTIAPGCATWRMKLSPARRSRERYPN